LAKAKPSEDELDRLRRFLRAHPGVLSNSLSLASNTRAAVIRNSFSATPASELLVTESCRLLAQQLGWDASSPLERVLIEHCVLTWVQTHHLERVVSDLQITPGTTPARLQAWNRSLDHAQRRHLRAIETLARIRALARRTPAILQVNVGGQQVMNGPALQRLTSSGTLPDID
jgi:hypothetical protein